MPQETMTLMRDVLEVLRWNMDDEQGIDHKTSFSEFRKRLESLICFESKKGLAYSYFYMLDAAELIEHGGSVPGWLSDSGQSLLADLKLIGEEDWDSEEVNHAEGIDQ